MSPLVPESGAYLGMVCQKRAGRTQEQEHQFVEEQLGRKLDFVRLFHAWNAKLPNKDTVAAFKGGRTGSGSWAARRQGNTVRAWRSIGSGAQDATIDAAAAALKAAFGDSEFLFIFHHEPENDIPQYGSSTEYRASWKRI